MNPRIAIDGRYLQDHFPGIGRFTFNLVRELAALNGPEDFVVFYDPSARNSRFDLKELESEKLRFLPLDVPPLSLRSHAALTGAMRREGVSLFHSPHYPLPLFSPRRMVCTVHDTIPLQDPAYVPDRGVRVIYRLAVLFALIRSRAVVADSSASREDIVRYFRAIPYRVKTVYLGVHLPEVAACASPRRHILYVGTNKPHKNLPRLIKAYAMASPELPLVIAGGMDPRYPDTQATAEALHLGNSITFLGHVSESRLEELYRSAVLFVFPSLAEGFGLPVLEAMARGVPVIASDCRAISEVVGQAALQVSAYDTEGLASAISGVLGDKSLAAEMACKGRERAALFPWSRTAEGYLRLYRQVAP